MGRYEEGPLDRCTGEIATLCSSLYPSIFAHEICVVANLQTRIITITLPVRANNDGMRMRLSMMFQVAGNAGVMPSYDIDSRLDDAGISLNAAQRILKVTLVLVLYFVAIEAFEVSGP